jgi:hypothetical protein
VISKAKTSVRSPAAALPSRGAGLISFSRWSEAFGLDRRGLVAEADECGADVLDEGCRSTDVAPGANPRWPANFAEQ